MLAVHLDRSDARSEGAGEPTSPAEAYPLYFGLVFRNLRRLGVDEAVIEDAVQDVFVVVFRRWDEFAKRSSLRTWLFGIVVRVARDYRRARRRHAARLRLAQQEAEILPPADSPHVDAELREATRLLHSVLDRLDEEQRTLVVLVDLEQIPTGEAAEILNLNPSTCRGKIAAARRAFAAAVERFGIELPFERSDR
jgi:RNA polymerase sigma-70 factor, ECF subfamily